MVFEKREPKFMLKIKYVIVEQFFGTFVLLIGRSIGYQNLISVKRRMKMSTLDVEKMILST